MRSRLSMLVLVILIAMTGYISAQDKQVMKIEGENLFLLEEFILVLAEEDGGVVVTMAPPEGSLPEEYEDIDLRKGDVVKMLNGERVKTTASFRDIYEKLEIGDEIRMGVKRGDEMFIVSFAKIDPAEKEGVQMIHRKVDGSGEEIEED